MRPWFFSGAAAAAAVGGAGRLSYKIKDIQNEVKNEMKNEVK